MDTTSALAERIADAAARRAPLRIAGRGTWLEAGRDVPSTETISTREISGLVAYVPDDLTLTARAGTTLAEIREATGAHNQWLALDPCGSEDGTIGATVATASYGPLSLAFGTPRDLVLGVEFVTGAGTVARGGGRVVKNVAGFDLTRLMTGAWGTLGVLAEVTVRLHAKPAVDLTLAVECAGDGSSLDRARTLLRRLPFTPYACEAVNEPMARALGLASGAGASVLVRLGGNAEAVAAQRSALAELGTAIEVDPRVWTALRAAEPTDSMVFRLSARPSRIGDLWEEARSLTRACAGSLIHANVGRGVIRVIVPASVQSTTALREALTRPSDAKRIGERLPTTLWSVISEAATIDALSSRVKRTFDPFNVLNPGILGETT